MANYKFYLKDKRSENKTIILMYFNYNNNVLKYSTKNSIRKKISNLLFNENYWSQKGE